MDERFDSLLDLSDPGHLKPAERLVFAPGVLLDAADFTAEQSYHRGRLARVLAHFVGDGTLAGLRVEHQAADEQNEERLIIHPGLAIDRLGRLLELRTPLCLRFGRWLAGQDPDALDASRQAAPAGEIVADIFLRFRVCERGATPAFASGPFDATDGHVPARLLDAVEGELILRTAPDPPLPEPAFSTIEPGADGATRLTQAQDAVLDGWREGPAFIDENGLRRGPEHPPGLDPSAVFLARISEAAGPPPGPEEPPERLGGVAVANRGRRFAYPPAALLRLLGFAAP